MKKMIFSLLFLIGTLQAQETKTEIGDVFILKRTSGMKYNHIDFPKRNIIIKRGAIPNFNNLLDEKLIVKSIEQEENGTTKAILQRKNGRNFFRFFPTVTANLEEALAKGELAKSK